MKPLLLILLLACTASARPFHSKPVTKPVAPVTEAPAAPPSQPEATKPETARFTVNPDGSVTRSHQADLELRDWLKGIQRENVEVRKSADLAETSEKGVRTELAGANGKLDTFQMEVVALTNDRNHQADRADKAEKRADDEHERAEKEKVARVAAENHASRIKTHLSIALAAFLVVLFNYMFGAISSVITKLAPALIPYALMIRIGGSVALAGVAWIIVARFV